MRVIFVYNSHNNNEMAVLENIQQEFKNHVQDIDVVEMQDAKGLYSIRTTPALIFIRDDFQGSMLLTEDVENVKFRATLELMKIMDEEDKNIHNKREHRIDNIVRDKANKQTDDAVFQILTDMGV